MIDPKTIANDGLLEKVLTVLLRIDDAIPHTDDEAVLLLNLLGAIAMLPVNRQYLERIFSPSSDDKERLREWQARKRDLAQARLAVDCLELAGQLLPQPTPRESANSVARP
jgi:hypothetical protein